MFVVKPRVIIITSGTLVLIGIAITAYQSQITSENLSNQQNILGVGAHMTITKEMDPIKSQKGVYSIQVTDINNDDNIKATVIEPAGTTIITKSITKSPIQETFKIISSGNFSLQIENQGKRDVQILGIIGYYPEGIELADISGFIFLIVGLSGLAISIMFLIKNRVKPQA